MNHDHRTPRRWGRKLTAAAATVALLTGLTTSMAEAAPQDVAAPVSGSLTINGSETPFATDTVTFEGTFDPETGEVTGTFSFPPGQTLTDLATVERTITQPNPGTGTIDLDTGAATFSAELVLNLNEITIPALGVEGASLVPCTYLMTLDLTGTYDEATSILSLSQDGFQIVINPADPADRCSDDPALGDTIDQGINDAVLGTDGTDNAMSASFDLSRNQLPDPPPEPEPEPEPAPAPPATPVDVAPTFTG